MHDENHPFLPAGLDPDRPDTPLTRLHARTEAAATTHGESRTVQTAVRMLTGRTSVEDVTSGLAAMIAGDDEGLSLPAAGALALTAVWHRSAVPALRQALTDDDETVREAALTVLTARAGRLRADQLLDADLVAAVHAACGDPSPGVRGAACAALGELARDRDLETVLPTLSAAVMDVDADLAAAAELGLTRLADRLDRPDLRPSTQY